MSKQQDKLDQVSISGICTTHSIFLLFKVNIASSHLYGFVLFSQSISFPLLGRLFILSSQSRPKYSMPVKILAILYGIWNLDFFRMFDLGICLETSTLFTFSLVAVYPLLLMIVTYLIYDHPPRPSF